MQLNYIDVVVLVNLSNVFRLLMSRKMKSKEKGEDILTKNDESKEPVAEQRTDKELNRRKLPPRQVKASNEQPAQEAAGGIGDGRLKPRGEPEKATPNKEELPRSRFTFKLPPKVNSSFTFKKEALLVKPKKGIHTAAASTRVAAILEEADVLKDLEELAGDGSDVAEGGPLVNQTREGELQVDKISPWEKVNGLLQKEKGSEKVKIVNISWSLREGVKVPVTEMFR